MPFNITKCHAMSFITTDTLPTYKLGQASIPWVDSTKYLGATLQQDLNFDQHISQKIDKATKILGAIKYTLNCAPIPSKLLAYTSLCRPILEYADTLWDPAKKQTAEQIENVQRKAVRFISNLRGRESVSDARQRLGLIPLADRRKNHRITLLLRILRDEQRHHVLSSSYDEILKSRADANMTTRAASRGELTSIWAKSKLYYDSFLPQTIRDLRITKN